MLTQISLALKDNTVPHSESDPITTRGSAHPEISESSAYDNLSPPAVERGKEAQVFFFLFSSFSVKPSPSALAYVKILPNSLGMTDASMTQETSPKTAASRDCT